MIVPGGGRVFAPFKSCPMGGMVLDEIDTCIIVLLFIPWGRKTSISGQSGTLPTLRVSIFRRNSRIGYKIWVKIPEQASQKPMIFQNRSNFS